ncbi:MAG: hypothetical protein K6F02_05220 [Prevotella sp.]|nr:hypothetical protein [Prevotella sp.]
MAKIQQKSEKISAFGGIFFVLDRFDRILSSVIDSHLGLRSKTSMDRAMEDIEQGRVYKYDSLDDLIKEIEG